MRILLSLLFTVFMLGVPLANAETGNAPKAGQKTVLITGATRGIGLRTTELLSQSGYFVFAGARKDEDMARLDQLENVKSVRLDVTEPEQIAAAVKTIEGYGAGLYGLVNNAGIATFEILNTMDDAVFDSIMQVNVYGPFRVTRAFAPLLEQQKGRVVNISSVGGVESGMGVGAYTMSKHAIEAFTDAQAQEMWAKGVWVSAVEPGNYGPPEQGGGDKLDVAKAVADALTAEKPKRRYLVVPEGKQAEKIMKAMIRRMLELNEKQEYSLSLEELQAMLAKVYKRRAKLYE